MEEQRKLVSIVFTDIKGYTAMMENDEAIALSTVERFEKFTRETCDKYNGRIINFMGDGALLIFGNSTDAVEFAIDIQTRFILEEKIQHRIGINTGEVIMKEGNIYGDSVNVAARIESLGIPGGVLISDSTYRLIKNKKEFEIKSMGKFHFKNKRDLMEVFAVVNEPLPTPQRKDLKGKTESKKLPRWVLYSMIAIILLLVAGVIHFGFNASTQPQTWIGTWAISVQDENKNFKGGELKLDKIDDQWDGLATVWYDQRQEVGLDIELNNITEIPDKNLLQGDWNSNLSGVESAGGKFEMQMNPSYDEFKGTFISSNGKERFEWNGTRK